MPGCAAPNCTNHSKKGFKFYRFPADPARREKWVVNSRRAEWRPTPQSRLCSVHFEESQFEQHRADGKRLLVPFAVPTLFPVPNPPKKLDGTRKSIYRRPRQIKKTVESLNGKSLKLDCEVSEQPLLVTTVQDEPQFEQHQANGKQLLLPFSVSNPPKILDGTRESINKSPCQMEQTVEPVNGKSPKLDCEVSEHPLPKTSGQANNENHATVNEVTALKKQVLELEEKLKCQNEFLSTFLTQEQIKNFQIEKKFIGSWGSETIEKALKLRSVLGKRGYIFLRNTGYPAPANSTLNKWLAKKSKSINK